MPNQRFLFLIPARGGSKGLRGKNVERVGGIPLVGRAARLGRLCAQAIGRGCRVVCSTDDPIIGELARDWGADVPFVRPAVLATDHASTMDVVIHALNNVNDVFDAVVLLQPTSPLTDVEDVIEAVSLYTRTGFPVVSVCLAEHPSEWLFGLDEEGRLKRLIETADLPHQRQQSVTTFRPNGAVYIAGVQWLRTNHAFYGPETRGFVMVSDRSLDVDTSADLMKARGIVAAQEIRPVQFLNRSIGPGNACFIVAEAGVNHNGNLDLALRLVDEAADAGADAVKFQTFCADLLVTPDAPKAEYQIRATDKLESQHEMLKRLELSEDAHRALMEHCRCRGIQFLSTPFDETSLDLLDSLGLSGFKLPSGELTNLPFLCHAARKSKALILSTGMSSLQEVAIAVDTIRAEQRGGLILLHCVSNYPAAPADVNLRAMTTLKEAFGVPVGFSDHTEGHAIALAAVAIGASVLEKHFTLDRGLPGPDHQASIEPTALRELVRCVRDVEAALGHGRKEAVASEKAVACVARKSLVARRTIQAGTVLEQEMVIALRPGTGLSPDRINAVIGKRALSDIPKGTVLQIEMLS